VVEAGDERIGLVGVAHPETAEINPEAAGLRFEPALPAVREAVAAVRERVDSVVVLAHLGTGPADGPGGRDLARELDVAAVLDGHRHEAVTTVVEGTPYARAGQGAEWLIAVDLGGGTLVRHPVSVGEPDAALADRVRDRAREAGLLERVGTADPRIPCGRPAVRAAESLVGNLVVDAYRRAAAADVALVAPAAVRAGPDLSGAVTAWELLRLVPFRDDLVSLAVDGRTLRETLGRVSGDAIDAWQEWYFGHVSGCTLRYDQTAAELLDATVGGEPIDPDGRYRVATSEYYVRTEHLFPGLSPDRVVHRHGPQYEAVRKDVTANGLAPALSGRVERPGFDGGP
jgi:2',3'-cyclic-nucleotide 2'-phosphodiesterase (5'-nucleotidase family)